MDGMTVDQVLAKIGERLHLSKETEHEVLAEIRTHLEDTISAAAARGEDEQAALRKAAERFGIPEASAELQALHNNHDGVEAILATALPVVFALILRWMSFAPDGSAMNWRQILTQPGFYLLAAVALIIPALCFHRWRYALVGWGIFWLLTVLFVIFPSINRW
jgi:hypothetical protein